MSADLLCSTYVGWTQHMWVWRPLKYILIFWNSSRNEFLISPKRIYTDRCYTYSFCCCGKDTLMICRVYTYGLEMTYSHRLIGSTANLRDNVILENRDSCIRGKGCNKSVSACKLFQFWSNKLNLEVWKTMGNIYVSQMY